MLMERRQLHGKEKLELHQKIFYFRILLWPIHIIATKISL